MTRSDTGEAVVSASPDIEALADNILRAAGSGLRHYTVPLYRQAILKATEEAVQAGREQARATREEQGEGM